MELGFRLSWSCSEQKAPPERAGGAQCVPLESGRGRERPILNLG